jgi:enoyl-[acyl-carrier-protein] reductase (NADH)
MNNMDNLIHALGFAALLAKNMNNMDNLIHALGFAASCYRRDARMVNFLRESLELPWKCRIFASVKLINR